MGPLGILVSTLQIALLQSWLSPEEFLSWGWRVPFWISLILLILAFKVRMALEETPIFLQLSQSDTQSKTPLRDNFRDPETRKRMFLLFFCISAGGAVLFFCVQVYTSIFLKTAVKLPPQLVDQLSVYATLALLPLTIFAGWLSDKIGRKPVVVTGLVLGATLILPAFHLLQEIGQTATYSAGFTFAIAGILIGLSAILALVVGPQTALLAELFPTKTRNSAATLPHNLAAGWIGGLLPLIVTWLNQHWESTVAGLWYPTIFLASSAVVALLYLPETNQVNLTK
jgi:MFS family permease